MNIYIYNVGDDMGVGWRDSVAQILERMEYGYVPLPYTSYEMQQYHPYAIYVYIIWDIRRYI